MLFHSELMEKIILFSLLHLLFLNKIRGKHYIFKHCLVIEKIKMLENHSYSLSVGIDIYAEIRNINSLKDNLTGGRILHTVKATEKG